MNVAKLAPAITAGAEEAVGRLLSDPAFQAAAARIDTLLVLRGSGWSRVRRYTDWSQPEQVQQLLLGHVGKQPEGFIDIEVLHHRRPVSRKDFPLRLGQLWRGARAMELVHHFQSELVPPSRSLRHNRSFSDSLAAFLKLRGLTEETFWRDGEVASFEVATWRLVWSTSQVSLQRRFRGDRVVQPAEITPELLQVMAAQMAGWLIRNTRTDGSIPYKYWPSRNEEPKHDNALRRMMATVWLNRWARRTGDDAARAAADRNLRRNMQAYFVERDGKGYIVDRGRAKLGAMAFAATVLRESPLRGELGEPLRKLDLGIDSLWREDGSFLCYAWPAPGMANNDNFYPGEALLYWGLRHRETGEAILVERALKSLAWYRDWHLQNRKPAFVPWHSQAALLFFEATGTSWLRHWVFAMNDWLIALQQTKVSTPDVHGRFYDPQRPEFGVPHASSTAVYLEGLADAFKLAHASGDAGRAASYARSIWMGVRNLRQLQFRDWDSMAYYGNHDMLAGAVRTEVYNNEIRVDNVQHSLGALMKLLEQPAFLATAPQAPATPLPLPEIT